MKRIIMLAVILGLLFCVCLVNAERVNESEGKVVKLSNEQLKKLNTFFSNFSEVFLKSFEEGKISNDELIDFGVYHNIWNNRNLFEETGELGRLKIQVKYVDVSIEKYFGKKIIKHETTSKFTTYKDGYYTIVDGSGEVYCFAQVTKLIDIGDNYFIAYTNEYAAGSGFTGDPNGSMEEWKKDGDVPDLSCKMRSIIKKVTENNISRYILIEYLEVK